MRRVVVETKDGPFFVRSGEIMRDWNGKPTTFAGLKLTKSKRWAAKFADPDEVASVINGTVAMGFYPALRITFAR